MVLVPPIKVAGIPIAIDDVLLVGLLLMLGRNARVSRHDPIFKPLVWSLAWIYAVFLSLSVAVMSGYAPVLGDLNSVFIVIKYSVVLFFWYRMARDSDLGTDMILSLVTIPLVLSGVIAIIQHFNIFGMSTSLIMMYHNNPEEVLRTDRPIGTFGNPNNASYFYLVALILLVFDRGRSLIIKVPLMIIVTVAFYLCFSRTGLIAILVLVILCTIYGVVQICRRRSYSVQHMLYVLALGFVMIPFALSYNRVMEAVADTRYFQFSHASGEFDYTFNGRLDKIWTLRLSSDNGNVFLGTGPGKALDSGTSFSSTTFDNSFLSIVIRYGSVGLVIFLCFMVSMYIQVAKQEFMLATALLIVTCIYFITTDIINNIVFSGFFFGIIGALMGRR